MKKYELTREKRYLINVLISVIERLDSPPEITLGFLQSMSESTHYDDREKEALNKLRDKHKIELRKNGIIH